ncbi:MAG TPA: hypothetical protein VFM25_07280 [Verrucomicrobiae bacterium]|nr:hypothetical protein [Verrucomicrobiae bacterium]
MQISRRILLACATTGILIPFILFADTEAQIKARQALEQKLGLAPSEPAATPAQAAPQTPPAQPAPAAQPTPAPAVKADSAAIEKARQALEQKLRELNGQPQTESPVAAPTTTVPAMTQSTPAQTPEVQSKPVTPLIPDSAAIEKARQALEQKMRELNGQSPVETPATTPAPGTEFTQTPAAQSKPIIADSQTIEKARQALEQKMKELDESFWPTPEESNATSVEKAREAMLKKMAEDQQQKELAAQKEQEKLKQQAEAKQNHIEQQKENPLGFPPIQGPPTGLSPEKEQQLQALLKDYEADKITPEQYHAQRAKILAEP